MNLPLLGALSIAGFQHRWLFLAALCLPALIGMYAVAQISRRRHVLRFANMELLTRIAPGRTRRWRHVPAILLITAMALLVTAMAGPTRDVRIPRDRAIVMLVIDVSESMGSDDVAPNRLEAAKLAGSQFADQLTPGINLGLVAYAGTATLLVPPTIKRSVVKAAIDKLQIAERTATGEGIFTALQAIAVTDSVIGGDGPPPARIVLESDGKETVPADPDQPRGAYMAARAAKAQGVAISTISFGTPGGYVDLDGQRVAVPVDDETLTKISSLSGGEVFHADSLAELRSVYATLQQQIGFQTVAGDASAGWVVLGTLLTTAAVAAGLLVNRRVPA